METFDLVVIGGGPAGYVAAIRAAQLGASVCLLEKSKPGGTCLNAGCIPTKALLHVSNIFRTIQDCRNFGINTGVPSVDWVRVQQYKSGVVEQLSAGVAYLLQKNRVRTLPGAARFLDQYRVEVSSPGARHTVAGRNFLICTGARNLVPPIKGWDNGREGLYDSTGILEIDRVPASLAIIGGGVIGLEMAQIFGSLGSRVTVVETLPRLLPDTEPELAETAMDIFKKRGTDIHLQTRVNSVSDHVRGKQLNCTGPGGDSFTITAETVLLAAGRKPFTEGLNLEGIGLATEDGPVAVNEYMQTRVPHIYAAGDVTGKHLYAHAAAEEGMTAAENVLGGRKKINHRTLPRAVFLEPQLASVGLTGKEAAEQGWKVRTGRFPLQANGKSVLMGAAGGMVKFVADDATGEILGLHLLAPSASELIGTASLAMSMEATLEEIAFTPFIHPSVSEALKEAALAALGRPLNI